METIAIESISLDVSIQALKIIDTDSGALLATYRKKLYFLLTNYGSVPIKIICIFGDGVGGKSFLMNLLINYLQNDCTGVKGEIDLTSGFKTGYRNGQTFNTVRVYPEIFIRESSNGTYGILLMDTQGLFDGSNSSVISLQFKICKMLSSVMLYNTKKEKVPNKSIYKMLESLKDGDITDHTDLIFLIRDKFAEDFMELACTPSSIHIFVQELHDANKTVRKLEEKFNDISNFMLPNPGDVVSKKKFKGKIESLSPHFVNAVNVLFGKITQRNSENLLTGSQLSEIFSKMTKNSFIKWEKFIHEFSCATGKTIEDNPFSKIKTQSNDNEHRASSSDKVKKNKRSKSKNAKNRSSSTTPLQTVNIPSGIPADVKIPVNRNMDKHLFVKNWLNDIAATTNSVNAGPKIFKK